MRCDGAAIGSQNLATDETRIKIEEGHGLFHICENLC
jgi:hypothetical protein